ncbi:MAG TPA: DUF2064 domain-containing protein [Nocardioidaceae bacterium]|jgi:glycosyltransferase A (GT-A) superfamily protein (DUF2064 family)|nr:DUF2064 domain-containing protein [Nocardioidaceae bacterium]
MTTQGRERAMNVLVVAKAPVPGLAKTRLAAHIGARAAAEVAAAAMLDLLATLRDDRRRVLVALAGELSQSVRQAELREALADCTVFGQFVGSFAERLVHAHRRAHELVAGPLLQVGMDTPQLDVALLHSAEEGLATHRAVLGPAVDGGWWALGLHSASPATALLRVGMSTATTGADTEASLLATGLVGDVVGRLDCLRDVDEWADAVEVAATVPGSLFAAVVADCYERATS